MACPTCGSIVLFGGIKDSNRKYCSKKCYDADEINRVASNIPSEQAEELAIDIHKGNCPVCNREGPVDIHKSYSVYSLVFYTSWRTNENMTCRKCARKKQFIDLFRSLFLGWWGLPFGVIVTPIILLANIVTLFTYPGKTKPTKALNERARLILAANNIESS